MTENETPKLPHELAVQEWPGSRNELALADIGGHLTAGISMYTKCMEDHGDDASHERNGGLCFDHGLHVRVDPESLAREVVKHTPHLRLVDAKAYQVMEDALNRDTPEHAHEALEVIKDALYNGHGRTDQVASAIATNDARRALDELADAGLAVVSAGAGDEGSVDNSEGTVSPEATDARLRDALEKATRAIWLSEAEIERRDKARKARDEADYEAREAMATEEAAQKARHEAHAARQALTEGASGGESA